MSVIEELQKENKELKQELKELKYLCSKFQQRLDYRRIETQHLTQLLRRNGIVCSNFEIKKRGL